MVGVDPTQDSLCQRILSISTLFCNKQPQKQMREQRVSSQRKNFGPTLPPLFHICGLQGQRLTSLAWQNQNWPRPGRWQGFPDGSVGKESTCNAGYTGDIGLIPGLGRSPGERHGNALQYSCLENPMDKGDWQARVQRIAKSWTRLSDHPRTHARTHARTQTALCSFLKTSRRQTSWPACLWNLMGCSCD